MVNLEEEILFLFTTFSIKTVSNIRSWKACVSAFEAKNKLPCVLYLSNFIAFYIQVTNCKPTRGLIFLSTFVILLTVIAAAFLGYSLPWRPISFFGCPPSINKSLN